VRKSRSTKKGSSKYRQILKGGELKNSTVTNAGSFNEPRRVLASVTQTELRHKRGEAVSERADREKKSCIGKKPAKGLTWEKRIDARELQRGGEGRGRTGEKASSRRGGGKGKGARDNFFQKKRERVDRDTDICPVSRRLFLGTPTEKEPFPSGC